MTTPSPCPSAALAVKALADRIRKGTSATELINHPAQPADGARYAPKQAILAP
jgi:hypothetical protein